MTQELDIPLKLRAREVREFAQAHQYSPEAFCKLLEKIAEQQGVYEHRLKDLAMIVDRAVDLVNDMQMVGEKLREEFRATRRQSEIQGEDHG